MPERGRSIAAASDLLRLDLVRVHGVTLLSRPSSGLSDELKRAPQWGRSPWRRRLGGSCAARSPR